MSNRRRSKGLVRKKELIALGIFLSVAGLLLAFIGGFSIINDYLSNASKSLTQTIFPPQKKVATFKKNQRIQIKAQNSKSQTVRAYQNWLGEIQNVHYLSAKNAYRYDVKFDNGKMLKNLSETVIKTGAKPKYANNQIIQLGKEASKDLDGASLMEQRGQAAKIDKSSPNYHDHTGGYKYDVTFDNGVSYTNIHERDLTKIYQVNLKISNSASQNNAVLKAAFAYAKEHPGTVLGLPKGDFKIGTANPDKDYLRLASDTVLRGNQTTLVVEGTAYWFGLATGPGAADGVKNFSMRHVNVRASDLTKGAHFMIMANHGSHWTIANNTFTMVHKAGSHVFDLGSLQNSVFDSNQFIGYAPDLTDKLSLGKDTDLHLYYSEAIQLDAAEKTGMWDASLIKNIDSNYDAYNAEKHLSSNITISNNAFLPYKNAAGKIVAYGATIGQHSSNVGAVTIYNNTFTSTLTRQLGQKDWVFEPIHVHSVAYAAIYDNIIN